MFDALSKKFQDLFSSLRGAKTLTEENVADAARRVRLALLEADVSYRVVGPFIQRVKEKALGERTVRSVSPGQQFVESVHEELVALMGHEEAPLDLKGKVSIVMVCGLQGSGKTTTCVKLAAFIQKQDPHKKILLAGCDLQRPAAVLQLQKLAQTVEVPVFSPEGETNPVRVATQAKMHAEAGGYQVLIVDTAGRLSVDESLMQELEEIKRVLCPREILFVANAMTGQDAVKVAEQFDQRVSITGSVLTMLDGNARAGAAISIREVTQKPLKFEGIGEKIQDLQLFHPKSMADRILGMGDVINLVKKAKENFSEEESLAMEKKMKNASFNYEDYLKQMARVKKMGSLQSLLKMLPGMSQLGSLDFSDQEVTRLEAMILSMTPRERRELDDLTHHRRKRIALGSGVDLDHVNRMVKGFKKTKQLFKGMADSKGAMKQMGLSQIKNMHKQWKGRPWH